MRDYTKKRKKEKETGIKSRKRLCDVDEEHQIKSQVHQYILYFVFFFFHKYCGICVCVRLLVYIIIIVVDDFIQG